MVLSRKPATDGRTQNTERSLHEALIGLVREKDYREIPVREILQRADVGRSTFYAHFAGKDELLASGIRRMVSNAERRSLTSFALPLFEHHQQHRKTGGMNRKSRALLHARLRLAIAEHVGDELHRSSRLRAASVVPPDLLGEFIASTFVVVLDWWLDTRSPLTPAQVDDLLRALVAPAVHGPTGRSQP